MREYIVYDLKDKELPVALGDIHVIKNFFSNEYKKNTIYVAVKNNKLLGKRYKVAEIE